MSDTLPVPTFYDADKVGEVWRVPYQERAEQARLWRQRYGIRPAAEDRVKIGLLLVDMQNTFCIPGFELFVGGRSGNGAVEDSQRLCAFLYRNLGRITSIAATLDTHRALQIFHPSFLVDEEGGHPAPYTLITEADVRQGRWKVNPALAGVLEGRDGAWLQAHLAHYVDALAHANKYALTVWPYHSMLGGIGHALVSAVEEACFFHSVARYAPTRFEIKGDNPFTEHYSAFKPEVLDGPDGLPIAGRSPEFVQHLIEWDMVIVAGQAKSHCVAWTVDDLLTEIRDFDAQLASKVYLLEDCTSPVVVPDAADYTAEADAAFRRFRQAGMHLVRSTDPIASWPDAPR
jgi:nicotinamidase-related amidase